MSIGASRAEKRRAPRRRRPQLQRVRPHGDARPDHQQRNDLAAHHGAGVQRPGRHRREAGTCAGAGRALGGVKGRARLHLLPAQGREVAPSRRRGGEAVHRRRRGVHLQHHDAPEDHHAAEGALRVHREDREDRRLHGSVHAEASDPERAGEVQLQDHPQARADQLAVPDARGPVRPQPDRHRPVHAQDRHRRRRGGAAREPRLLQGPRAHRQVHRQAVRRPEHHGPGADGIMEKGGQKLALSLKVPIEKESEAVKRVVLAFQNYLKSVGVAIKVEFKEWQAWKEDVFLEHNFDIMFASWVFDDSADISSLFHSAEIGSWKNNFGGYSNPEVDGLIVESKLTLDHEKRRTINRKLHAILAEEQPYAFLWTLTNYTAYHSKLRRVQIHPYTFFSFSYECFIPASEQK